MTRPHAIVTAILLALFALTAPAAAQGTSDTLPDPISSNDLDRWASWLELTEQQRLAIDPFHDDYRTAFKSLREGDIEAFMEDFRGLRQGFMQIPNSEQIEDLLDQSERLLGRIRTLDERLFAGMDTVLTEEH